MWPSSTRMFVDKLSVPVGAPPPGALRKRFLELQTIVNVDEYTARAGLLVFSIGTEHTSSFRFAEKIIAYTQSLLRTQLARRRVIDKNWHFILKRFLIYCKTFCLKFFYTEKFSFFIDIPGRIPSCFNLIFLLSVYLKHLTFIIINYICFEETNTAKKHQLQSHSNFNCINLNNYTECGTKSYLKSNIKTLVTGGASVGGEGISEHRSPSNVMSCLFALYFALLIGLNVGV